MDAYRRSLIEVTVFCILIVSNHFQKSNSDMYHTHTRKQLTTPTSFETLHKERNQIRDISVKQCVVLVNNKLKYTLPILFLKLKKNSSNNSLKFEIEFTKYFEYCK